MPPVPPRRRRARPVADAPIESLLSGTEELAKGWLLALLEEAPLEQAADIAGAELTREGPRLCEAAVRAIASDVDLRRLQAGGALRPLAARIGELTGAATPMDISRAVDALQAVLWAALRDELRSPDPDLVSELTERLTLIGELLRTAGLERAADGMAGERVGRPGAAESPSPGPGGSPDGRAFSSAPPPRSDPPPLTAVPDRGSDLPAVWPDDADRGRAEAAEPLWVGALADEIRRSFGSPLSLLVAEFEDADRVIAAQTPSRARETLSRFAAAVRSVVRHQDILVCESESRAWVIATGTGRAGARALGERIAEAVKDSDSWHGAPLRASVGLAVLGEDGRTAAELIDAAEEARFAAAAAGVRVFRGDAEPPETG